MAHHTTIGHRRLIGSLSVNPLIRVKSEMSLTRIDKASFVDLTRAANCRCQPPTTEPLRTRISVCYCAGALTAICQYGVLYTTETHADLTASLCASALVIPGRC